MLHYPLEDGEKVKRRRSINVDPATRAPPILIWSDAMWDASAVEPARLGFVVNFPEVRAPDNTIIDHERWLHSEFVVGPDVLALLEDREQYITQLELLAAVAVYRFVGCQ